MPNLKIEILWEPTRERVRNAVVRLRDDKHAPRIASVDDDGECTFNDIEAGPYRMDVFGPDIRPGPSRAIVMADDDVSEEVSAVHLTDTVCEKTGRSYFIALIVLLFLSIGCWAWLHDRYPNSAPQSLAPQVQTILASARAAHDLQPGEAEPDRPLPGLLQDMGARVSSAAKGYGSLQEEAGKIGGYIADIAAIQQNAPEKMLEIAGRWLEDDPDNESLENVAGSLMPEGAPPISPDVADAARRALTVEGFDAMEAHAVRLGEMEAETASLESSFPIWSTKPKLYLEILFFAFFGTIVRQIMVVQNYLRWGRFYKQGLYQHVALLITVPILTLVFVAVVTMARLTAGEANIVVDLSDPVIVAGVSFLVALIPWGLWERLLASASGVVTQTRKND